MSRLGDDGVGKVTLYTTRRDTYSWRPLYWAMAIAGVAAAWLQFLNFVPIGGSSFRAIYVVRDLLNIFLPLGALVMVSFGLILLVLLVIALVGLRFRRMFSLGCAMIAVPVVYFGVLLLPFFSPYFWYVLFNQARFESMVKAADQPGMPAFVRLEARDVSVGLIINPPTFTSIVYDESDELRRTPSKRSAEWDARNAARLSMDGVAYDVTHLYAHFYLVSSTVP